MRSTVVFAVLTATATINLTAQDSARTRQPGSGWLGIGMSCSDCTLSRRRLDGSPPRSSVSEWRFRGGYPALNWLDSDGPAYRAGLRAGDTLISIDGTDLLTLEGGRAIAAIVPDQRVDLAYRREGRTQHARVTVGTSPEYRRIASTIDAARIAADSMRAMSAARQAQVQQAQREMVRAQQDMSRLQAELQRAQSLQLDSARRRVMEAQRRLNQAMSMGNAFGLGIGTGVRSGKCMPGTPNCTTVYVMPEVSASPRVYMAPPAVAMTPPTPPMAATPFMWSTRGDAVRSISSDDYSGFGRLRYSGRLGQSVIEARAPGPVNAVEEGDSVVIITSGDMSVRVLLRPRTAFPADSDSAAPPAPAAAPAPVAPPARRPRPAGTPRPAPRPMEM